MKVATNQIEGIVQHPPSALRVILIYGPDAGLVSERARILSSKFCDDPSDPFRVSVLTGADLQSAPSRLAEEMAALPFGGGCRLVRLQQAVDANHDALTALLSALPNANSVLIIEGSDLDKKSKLRALCETTSPAVCALPCYVEDALQRQKTIQAALTSAGLKIDRALLSEVSNQMPDDRLALLSEIEKLSLYCAGQTTVTKEDVEAIITDVSAAKTDDLVLAVGNGNAAEAGAILTTLWAEQLSPVAVLRALQRHFWRIQKARSLYDSGLSARESIDSLKPKVFWKQVESLTRQVQSWSAPKIEHCLQRLFDAEAEVKTTGAPDTALVAQLLLQLAASARR